MASIAETARKVQGGEISSESLVKASLARIEETRGLNAYISVLGESALERARSLDKRRAGGEKLGPLAGIPVAIKDNITLAQGRTTCASKILEKFQSPYDATASARLLAAGAVPVGKTNMDEFAMGSTSETSAFGAPKNPLDASILADADKAIREQLAKSGIMFGAKPAEPKPGDKKVEPGKPEIPPTLAKLPAANAQETDGGAFAALDRLAESDPEAYEAAYGKLTEAEREAYLARG